MKTLNFIPIVYMLNLQLFADGNINVNGTAAYVKSMSGAEEKYDSENGPLGLSAEMKTFYDKNLIRLADPNLVHDQFGQKKPIPQGSGKTIEFRGYGPLAKVTTALQEGVTPFGQKLEVYAITSEVAQYGDFVAVSDMLSLTAIDNNIVEAQNILASQAGRTLDTVVRDALMAGTVVQYCHKLTDGKEDGAAPIERSALTKTSQLTVKEIQRAVANLAAQNAPKIGDSYVGIIHPFVKYDLMNDPKWEDWNKYTSADKMFKNEIGRIAGVRFVESSEAKIFYEVADGPSKCPIDETAGMPLAVFATLIIGQGAYGTTEITGGGLQTFVKPLGSGGSEDPLNQRATVGWKATKTAEILVPEYMIRIESCSSEFSLTAQAN